MEREQTYHHDLMYLAWFSHLNILLGPRPILLGSAEEKKAHEYYMWAYDADEAAEELIAEREKENQK